jgi:hypothetical protein
MIAGPRRASLSFAVEAGRGVLPLANIRGKSMFRAFLTFDNFIFPKLTVVVYWIGIVLILIAGIVGIISTLIANNLLAVLGALIGTIVALVVWRITIELWMVLFSIYDVLRDIRDQKRA